MRIPEKGLWNSPIDTNRLAEKPKPTVARHDHPQEKKGRDRVSLTSSGHGFTFAIKAAQGLPDSRDDRINQIKRRLEAGMYQVNGRRIAASLIDEAMENNRALMHVDADQPG